MANVKLSISKTIVGGPDFYVGGTAQFKIRVSNPSVVYGDDADGTFIQDILPNVLLPVSWTASYHQGATGPTSGAGQLYAQITHLPASSYVDFTVNTTVSATAIPCEYTTKAIIRTAPGTCNLGKDISECDITVLYPTTNITTVVTSGTVERGKTVPFTITVTNTGPLAPKNVLLTQCLPDGMFLKEWTTSFTTNVSGCMVGDETDNAYLLNFPVSGTAVLTAHVYVSGATCLDSYTYCVNTVLPTGVTAMDGSSCLRSKLDFQVVNPSSLKYQKICGCWENLCSGDSASKPGYVIIRLQTAGKAINPITKVPIKNLDMRFDMNPTTGCWESCLLPVNAQLITEIGSPDRPIESSYRVLEYLTDDTGKSYLASDYEVQLDADTTYPSCLRVGIGCEIL